jgi:hypothetical protein
MFAVLSTLDDARWVGDINMHIGCLIRLERVSLAGHLVPPGGV